MNDGEKQMITKSSLTAMIQSADEAKRAKIVGRALVAIFKRQTETERQVNATQVNNLRGFAPQDAKAGSITAKYFIKNGTLDTWQVDKWLKVDVRGTPRIVKYWRQLDEVARERAAA